jgi:hypothetical protein
MQPCFYLERTNATRFRGSILGLGFAYCDFTLHSGAQGEQPPQNEQLSVAGDK